MKTSEPESILSVRNFSLSFQMYDRALNQRQVKMVSNLNLDVNHAEILAVVGSSGSGKSLLAHAILGVLPRNATVDGSLIYQGEQLTQKRSEQLRGNEIALVPQSINYLDPLMKVGNQISPTKTVANQALTNYQLSPQAARLYPHQLSGGMARRILLATATANQKQPPKLIIADEPTPGLTNELATSVMEGFRELADTGTAILLITHDLDLAISFADRIAVFYAGTTVETAQAADFKTQESLRHPYTKALWRAMPKNGFAVTDGHQPHANDQQRGCPYAPRCELKTPACTHDIIQPRSLRGGKVSCLHAT